MQYTDDADRTDHLDEGVDLVGIARDLDPKGGRGIVDDLRLEDVHGTHDELVLRGLIVDLDEQQFALDGVLLVKDLDFLYVVEFAQLVQHLRSRVTVSAHGDRDTGILGRLGDTDGQSVDVEAAAGEHAGDAGQDAELVVDVDRDHESGLVFFHFSHLISLLSR